MLVYILAAGEYSDYRVHAVCSSPENAQVIMDAYPGVRWRDLIACEIDHIVDAAKHGYKVYRVEMQRSGNAMVEEAYHEDFPELPAPNFARTQLVMYVLAIDESHAVKIVNEKRAELIASEKWKASPYDT